MCRLNPKVDFAFKKLFGSEENKDILLSFINSMLSEDQQIKHIELKNPYNIANYNKAKMSILDIKGVDEKGIWYDIEMQLTEQVFYEKRAFYYWAKVYSDQLESGENYDLLRKTICINILNFNYLDEEDFHNVYKVYNEKTKKELSSVFEMHFVELEKFKKDFKDLSTSLDRWVAFLNRAYEIEKDKIPEELAKDKAVTKAVEKLDIMYLNKDEREIYESDLKRLRDYRAEIETAQIKGEEQGIAKGMAKGIAKGMAKGMVKGIAKGKMEAKLDVAKNLLDILDDETISIKTGLDIEEVRKLRN